MASPATQLKTSELFYPTEQKASILESLARYDTLTTEHLVYLLFGRITDERKLEIAKTSVRRTLRNLEADGLVAHKPFTPDDYKGAGCPSAWWLLGKGALWTLEKYPATDPIMHDADRSLLYIPHDIKAAETHMALFEMADRQNFDFGAKKSNLYHLVKPDRLYEISQVKTAHLFHEEECAKKSFKAMFEKLLPYVRFEGTSKFKNVWGFRNFQVLIPMRDEAAMKRLILHLLGDCDCPDQNQRRIHKSSPYKLISDKLLFTTHAAVTADTEGKIFTSTASSSPVSLLDIIY
jgi:hypothetical protein